MLGGVSDLVTLAALFPWNQSGINNAHFMDCFDLRIFQGQKYPLLKLLYQQKIKIKIKK